MTTQLRLFLAIFLIIHGFIHASLSWVPAPEPGKLKTPFFPGWWREDVDPTWPIQKLVHSQGGIRTCGWVMWVLICAACLVAAIGLLLNLPTMWIPSAAVMAVTSLVLILAYWHPWLPVGILIDLAILISLIFKIPSTIYLH